MAATANQRRVVAIELQEAVAEMKSAVDAVDTVVSAWTTNALDAALPTGLAVKGQLTAFDAISKPGLTMGDAIVAIRGEA